LVESVVVSVEVSLLGAFSVLVSDFLVVLLVESSGVVSVFVDSELAFFFFVEGLVALSAAGLFVVDDLEEGAAGVVGGVGVGVGFADGVMVAAAVAAGVIVAPRLAVAAGVALAFVEAVTPVVVLVVGTVVVVPVVAVTPTLKLGVTP
jgi:hypothetical protein